MICTQCDSIVRVPADRLHQDPRCPRCRGHLFAAHPVDLDDARFERHLSHSDVPLVVDFWAPWCAPCMMAPDFEEAAKRLEPQARFAKVNSDQAPGLSTRFGIRGIPTLIVFRQGQEVARKSGAMDLNTLLRWVNLALRTA